MRILHFLGIGRVPKKPMIDPAGGIERVALEIARIQVRRGANVTVASMMPKAWQGAWEGVHIRHLRPYSWARLNYRGHLRDFRVHLSLASCVRLGRFDLVHLHEYTRMRFFERLPTVMHFHNNPLDGVPDAELERVAAPYWRAVGKAGAQIAVSGFVGRRLQQSHERAGADAFPSNIVVNRAGVHAELLHGEELRAARQRVRRELGLKDSDVLFMFAGALRSEKGVIQLAQAFLKLAAEHDNAFLAIAGGRDLWVDGHPPGETAEAQIHILLVDAVKQRRGWFLGMVSPVSLPSYYAAADVFVLPSMFQETFGLVILEAFSAGTPVIGTRSGGIPELVEEGRTGLLVNQGDVNGLCDAMRRLLLDSELRERLGRAARETSINMPWENTVDRLEAIYRDIGVELRNADKS